MHMSIFSERQRCALWVKKLCEPSGAGTGIAGRRNRNSYAKLLLHMLKRGVLEDPFTHEPEPGMLKTLPSYMVSVTLLLKFILENVCKSRIWSKHEKQFEWMEWWRVWSILTFISCSWCWKYPNVQNPLWETCFFFWIQILRLIRIGIKEQKDDVCLTFWKGIIFLEQQITLVHGMWCA